VSELSNIFNRETERQRRRRQGQTRSWQEQRWLVYV